MVQGNEAGIPDTSVLTNSSLLKNPDFDHSFTMRTDASETGLGATLSQNFCGEERLVLYMRRKLISAEWHYTTME